MVPFARALGCAVPLLSAVLAAQEPVPQGRAELLKALRNLMDTQVIVASKEMEKASEAPAIVSVVTAEEIRMGGFRSVAEALAHVPGLYGIDDHLSVNFGIRGINGGLRAWNRIMKVLIDGQSAAFRPDTSTFLGPELIPMEAIERIEIVRGPASALYGANAFLGVINIVTRVGTKGDWNALLARASSYRGNLGGGAEGVVSTQGETSRLFLAASVGVQDLSGDRLPASSPRLSRHPRPITQDETSRPGSFYGAWRRDLPRGAFELSGHWSHLDSRADLLDFGTLTHENRVVQDNGFLRARTEYRRESLALQAALAYAEGQPGSQERLSSGSGTTYPRRDVGYRGLDAMAEARWEFKGQGSLTAGLDHTTDRQRLMTVYTVDAATGKETLTSLAQGDRSFQNTGAYLQLRLNPIPGFGITGNLRHDRHNVYGSTTSYRLGLVWRLRPSLHAKVLYGTSFKAPAPLQLFAQPLFAGDVLGNPSLEPERARTFEVELGWKAAEGLVFAVNGFRTRVTDKVELVPLGDNFISANLGTQDSTGYEATFQWVPGRLGIEGSTSWQRTDNRSLDALRQPLEAPTALYPTHAHRLRVNYRLGHRGNFELSTLRAGARRGTDSNFRFTPGLRPYTTPAYTRVDLACTSFFHVGRVNLRINNLLGEAYAEPGFGGIDLPGRGREVVLAYGLNF